MSSPHILSRPASDEHGGKYVPGIAKLEKQNHPNYPAFPTHYRCSGLIDPEVKRTMFMCWQGITPWPLFLFGEPGSGKTCASLVMLDAAGCVTYYTLVEWCQRLADVGRRILRGAHGYVYSMDDVEKAFSFPQLVVIDEIAERGERVAGSSYDGYNPKDNERFKLAIDWREDKPIIVISNRTLSEVAKIHGDAIASRISGGTKIEMNGDRRATK